MADRPTRTKVTKTPIRYDTSFESSNPRAIAQYRPNLAPFSILPRLLLNSIQQSPIDRPSGEIVVNPDHIGSNDFSRILRHEDVHALLEKLGLPAMNAAKETKGYENIAKHISPLLGLPLIGNKLSSAAAGGIPSVEAPAFAASYGSDLPISFEDASIFVEDFPKKLSRISQRAGEMYKLLSKE